MALTRRALVIVALILVLVSTTPMVSTAYTWWEELGGCVSMAVSGGQNPAAVAQCVVEIMLDIMHGSGWDWT